jgi:hypothetical protein
MGIESAARVSVRTSLLQAAVICSITQTPHRFTKLRVQRSGARTR